MARIRNSGARAGKELLQVFAAAQLCFKALKALGPGLKLEAQHQPKKFRV